MTPAVKFLAALFKRSAAPVFVTSLANDRAATRRIPPRSVVTRDGDLVDRFVAKWDQPERGLFFCVATLKPGITRRAKENLDEIVCLHADLDAKHIAATPEETQEVLSSAPLPSLAVSSGHGLHLYWRLQQALPATPGNIERVETALKKVSDVYAGDRAVCECARLMRVPGSHNSKNGEWTPVRVVRWHGKSYSLEALEEWLATAKPLLQRRPSEKRAAGAADAFSELARAQVIVPPIDVDARLATMEYRGPGESGIHNTQLATTAALLNRGWPIDHVVARVLDATAVAVGREGRGWDWRQEERDLRLMCRSWLAKHPCAVFVED